MDQHDFMLREIDEWVISQYRDFLPQRVFDAHMHLPYNPSIPSIAGTGNYFRDYATEHYMEEMGQLLPGVETIRLNMMPMPAERSMRNRENGLRDLGNDHVFRMYALHPEHVVTPMILPSDTEEFLFQLASRPGCRGFKCYAYVAGVEDLETAAIEQYLPDSAWIVADQLKLPIYLHLFRRAALSDPDNFQYITTMTHRYPNAQLVLCHCARAFASWTLMKSIKALEDQGNIWFDLSAICESSTMAACIIKNAGKRTVWGSDYPAARTRGRAVSVGNWQSWLSTDAYDGPERVWLPAENLMAFYQASLLLDLDQTQITDVFYNNAVSLFGDK